MSIISALKKIKASWTDSPLAGFVRVEDNTQKLDVVVSESVALELEANTVVAEDDDTNLDDLTGLVVNSILSGRIDALNVKPLRMDASTHSIQIIDYAHHEVHSGSFYYVKGQAELDGAGDTLDFLYVVPNTNKWPHAQWDIDGEAEFTLSLYEGVVTSNDGGAVTIFNANRNSANSPGVAAYSGPTLNSGALGDGGDGGNLVWEGKIGSGRNATTNRETAYEFIAKQNTKYWFRISKEASGVHWVDYDFNWYEHTDKD